MGLSQQTTRRRTAIVTLCSLFLSPAGFSGVPLVSLIAASEQATPAVKPAAPATAKAPATAPAAPAIDGGWPRRFTTASGAVRVIDRPAHGSARSFLVQQGLERDGYAALQALIAACGGQSERRDEPPILVDLDQLAHGL